MTSKKELMHNCAFCGKYFPHVKQMRSHLKKEHAEKINKEIMSNVRTR